MPDSITTLVEEQRERLASLERIAKEVPDATSGQLADGTSVIFGTVEPDKVHVVETEKGSCLYAYKKVGGLAVFHGDPYPVLIALLDFERAHPFAYALIVNIVKQRMV